MFMDYEGLVMPTGLRAGNLREFTEIVKHAPLEMLRHHLHRSSLRHKFGVWDYPNDFAAWASHGLEDRALAEKIAAMDPYAHDSLEQAREHLTRLLEEHLDTLMVMPAARPGMEFHFSCGHYMTMPGEKVAWSLDELRARLEEVPASSIFLHFHEAKLRGGSSGRDDFSTWTLEQFGSHPFVESLKTLDFYFYTLEDLRSRILEAYDSGREASS